MSKESTKPAYEYAPYPKLDPIKVTQEQWTSVPVQSPTGNSVHIFNESATTIPAVSKNPKDVTPQPEQWTSVPVQTPRDGSGHVSNEGATTMPVESNPYVSPAPASSSKNKLDSIKDVLGTWGKKAAEATKKAEGIAGDMWQHLKTGPSLADAAVGRIAQGTKVLAEGGYEKVFRQTFETVSEEQLLKSYACYLSTSAGPVMGTLYLSSVKLAFCSDNPLSYKIGEETQWSYYKVVIPLHQLKAVNPSMSKINPAEKYVQVISVDNHEFWLMGFVNYESAVKNLKSAMEGGHI